jgi:hypothetical protein
MSIHTYVPTLQQAHGSRTHAANDCRTHFFAAAYEAFYLYHK